MQFKETSGNWHRMGIKKNNSLLQLGELNNAGTSFTPILSVQANGDSVGIGTTNLGSHQLVVEGGKAETGGSCLALKTAGNASGTLSD